MWKVGWFEDGGCAAEVPNEPVGEELSLGVCLVATWQVMIDHCASL